MNNKNILIICCGMIFLYLKPMAARAQAPISLAGFSMVQSHLNGNSETVYISADGVHYSTSSTLGTTTGTTTYVLQNTNTAVLNGTDSYWGPWTETVVFSDPMHGSYTWTYFVQGAPYGVQIGTFTLSGAVAPSLTLNNPSNGQRWSNSVFTASGNWNDNWMLTVWYQLNGGNWTSATTGLNNWGLRAFEWVIFRVFEHSRELKRAEGRASSPSSRPSAVGGSFGLLSGFIRFSI